jgi:predicted phosphodiesterase
MARKAVRAAGESAIPELPEPLRRNSAPFRLDALGWWLIVSDLHIPFHDKTTVDLAVAEARRRRAVGVLLNGDILDSHELSRFEKSPDDPRYPFEIAAGRQFLAYLRGRLPKAIIAYKEGNHDARLYSYLCSKAPALFGLEELSLPHLLHFGQHGVEHVGDLTVVQLGKLNVIHGHEYRPGIQAPVNPARGLFLRAKGNALTSHFHQTSEHHEPTITGKQQGTWSVGCACSLSPRYMPLNKWNLGFAFVDVGKQGAFRVENLRVLNGEVV